MTAAMTHSSSQEVAHFLQALAQRAYAGEPWLTNTMKELEQLGWPAPRLVVGALCAGGLTLATHLLQVGQPALSTPDAQALCADALCMYLDLEPDEAVLGRWLATEFDLTEGGEHLVGLLRADLLIHAGGLENLPGAIGLAMQHQRWSLALHGLQRCREAMGDGTTRDILGLGSVCLHGLKRFAEAEAWARAGLGDQNQLLEIPPTFSEADLLQRWSGQIRPTVSIICATFNHERYIESAMRGFLSQDCPFRFEVLVHDDASTDQTATIIRDWQARYPNVIVPVLQTVNQFSQGKRPFDAMLARARGDFIAVCEGDDFWIDATKLGRQVGFLVQHPEYACSAHNYYHYQEAALTVKPWTSVRRDHTMSARQLKGLARLLWLPTLVFRKQFSHLPPERDLVRLGDQFLTSLLGTCGPCMFFESMLGAVRRENEFSTWSPLSAQSKERLRVQTWAALLRLHRRLGDSVAAQDLMQKIESSSLDPESRQALVNDTLNKPLALSSQQETRSMNHEAA